MRLPKTRFAPCLSSLSSGGRSRIVSTTLVLRPATWQRVQEALAQAGPPVCKHAAKPCITHLKRWNLYADHGLGLDQPAQAGRRADSRQGCEVATRALRATQEAGGWGLGGEAYSSAQPRFHQESLTHALRQAGARARASLRDTFLEMRTGNPQSAHAPERQPDTGQTFLLRSW